MNGHGPGRFQSHFKPIFCQRIQVDREKGSPKQLSELKTGVKSVKIQGYSLNKSVANESAKVIT